LALLLIFLKRIKKCRIQNATPIYIMFSPKFKKRTGSALRLFDLAFERITKWLASLFAKWCTIH